MLYDDGKNLGNMNNMVVMYPISVYLLVEYGSNIPHQHLDVVILFGYNGILYDDGYMTGIL